MTWQGVQAECFMVKIDFSFSLSLFFFFFFLGLYLRHVEVSRLGVKSEM